MDSQKEVAAALRELASMAKLSQETERLNYLAAHVEFLVPYTEAWTLAHHLHGLLTKAGEAKKEGQLEDARALVRAAGVPLWLRLAGEVRAAVLAFQRVAANRPDLGTLASLQNKFVRLALHRLPLSIQEYLGEMPAEITAAVEQALAPDADAPGRLIVPTRPTLLREGESVRVMAIVAGNFPASPRVLLETRPRGTESWTVTPLKLLGRRTYEARLGPFDPRSLLIEYGFRAEGGGRRLSSPGQTLTLL
jgi:hypothetical protein